MDRTERFYRIDQLLSGNRVVPFSVFLERLEVSRATIKRDLEYMRNRLHAPIVWDRDAGGYRFEHRQRGSAQYELPGLWFSAPEVHALLTMQQLLANLDTGGLLGPHIRPLIARLNALLGSAETEAKELRKRVRIFGVGARTAPAGHFEKLGSALLRRKRLQLTYYVRSRDEMTEREVSPQRLVHYRENWYLDAWCHSRRALRSFALDAIERAEILDEAAREVPERTLDAVLGAGYGIFSGRALAWAKLRFTPERSRWVAKENWHPKQKGRFDAEGRYILQVPYSDPRELIMDVLKHGSHVTVLGPRSLRVRIIEELDAARASYVAKAGSRRPAHA